MRRSTTMLTISALAAATVLSGCSKAGSTTCKDFNAQSSSDQASTIRSLLKEHDLDPNSSTNVLELTEDVHDLCRSSNGSANPSATLEQSTNWSSSTW